MQGRRLGPAERAAAALFLGWQGAGVERARALSRMAAPGAGKSSSGTYSTVRPRAVCTASVSAAMKRCSWPAPRRRARQRGGPRCALHDGARRRVRPRL